MCNTDAQQVYVITLNQRRINVYSTLCAQWVTYMSKDTERETIQVYVNLYVKSL